jgi:hypothetical protein
MRVRDACTDALACVRAMRTCVRAYVRACVHVRACDALLMRARRAVACDVRAMRTCVRAALTSRCAPC